MKTIEYLYELVLHAIAVVILCIQMIVLGMIYKLLYHLDYDDIMAMNKFTLTQNQIGKNLYLLPDGAGCAVPSTTITVRPDGDSAVQCSAFPGAGEDNYEDVDEVIADDDTTYTYWNTPIQQKFDRYSFTIPDEAKTIGVPTSIKVYAKMRRAGAVDAGNVSLGRGIGTPGGDNCSWTNRGAAALGWITVSHTYNTNPDTGVAWTWAELEAATLVFGVITNNGDEGRCTQIYAEITYTHTNSYTQIDDPIDNPDDDATYIHNDTAALIPELFTGENHTTETGTINYLQVFTRAKSHLVAPSSSAIYKIVLDDSACTDTQKSDTFNLVTTYSKYSHVWNTNPYRGDIAFDWNDVDNYQFGIESQSPVLTGKVFTSFRPNAAGDLTQRTPVGAANNWDCVNEAVADDGDYTNATYDAAYKKDYYNIPNHTTETGTITKIVLFGRGRRESGLGFAALYIKTGGLESGGASFGDNVWTLRSSEWDLNPNTGVAWTWADIDGLQIGFNGSQGYKNSQLYLVVYYGEVLDPDLRTTQCYMKVNYDETVTCDLNQPEEISQDYAQNVKMLNHWSGNRSVYGLSKSHDTTVITGYEIEDSDCTDACARLKCVEELGKQGDPVSLTGLGYSDYNDTYQILSWGWKCISKKPVYYTWILEVERTT